MYRVNEDKCRLCLNIQQVYRCQRTQVCCRFILPPSYSFRNIDNLDDIVAVAIEAEFHSSNMANLGADDNGAGGGNGGEDGRADHGGSQMPQEGYRPKSDATKLKAEEKAKLEELFIASRALVEPLDLETSVRGF